MASFLSPCLGLFLLLTGVAMTLAQDFPENDYVHSVRRDWLVAAERELQKARPQLSPDEAVVDNYFNYLKYEEFMRTKNENADNFPPARPIEEVQRNIESSEVYRVLLKLPKGGNMHSHEYHQLSKRLLLELIWDAPEFDNLYILPEDHPTDPWKLDFFLTPPNAEWIKVKDNQDKYSIEQVYPNQILLGLMNDYAKSRPTDSAERWRQLNPLWGRCSAQVAGYIPIKKLYLAEMYKQGLEEGVQYIETRRSFGDFGRLYELDPDPQYAPTGKRYFPPDTEIQLTLEVIANVTREYPEFIGHRRIGFISRRQSKETIQEELARIMDLHERYPDHVIGADLVGQEDAGYSHLHFIDQLLELHDPATGKSKVPLFLHSSETSWMEEMRSSNTPDDVVATLQNAYESIILQSKRIGHGLGFAKHPGLLQLIRERGIPIEICPVSNQVLGYSPDLRNHPAVHFLRSGVSIVLGSDDPGTFGIDSFTIDWYEAFMAWGLGLADLKQFALTSIAHSGLSAGQQAAALTDKWTPQWNAYIATMKTEACAYDFSGRAPAPSVVRIFPRSGALSGSTRVHVYGRHLQRGICRTVLCRFGTLQSAPATYVSHDHVICETPERGSGAAEETVVVQLSLDGGDTFIPTNENFNYIFPTYTVPEYPVAAGTLNAPGYFTLSILCFTSYFKTLCL